MKRSGITRKEVLMRIRRQMPLVEKRKMADVIIDNSQTLEALYEQVDQALMKALERASTMENEKIFMNFTFSSVSKRELWASFRVKRLFALVFRK